MIIEEWAIKWGVSPEAMLDMRRVFNDVGSGEFEGMREAAVQSRIRLDAANKGIILWRNNVGAYSAKNPPSAGTRWGLANDTPAMNKEIKSSDLVGIKPVLITPAYVGRTLGQFTVREAKNGSWRYTGTPREVAQLNYMLIVISHGGDAAFANSTDTL